MKILLTNDDGIYAPGLWALYTALAAVHDVSVIAPDRERSAVGHGITLNEPLRLTWVAVNGRCSGYAVTGTPVDCVKLGLAQILKGRPDMVISGINAGANVGMDINYSGTVSAAREAAVFGIPAVAVSVERGGNDGYEDIARFVASLAENVRRKGLPLGTMLNVNVPNVPFKEMAGLRISCQGSSSISEHFEKRIDPRQREYYWQAGDPKTEFTDPDADGAVIKQKYISITPIKYDMTDYQILEELKAWEITGGFKITSGR